MMAELLRQNWREVSPAAVCAGSPAQVLFYVADAQKDIVTALSEITRLRAALAASMTALDDWLNIHASRHCNPERVEEARSRIMGACGTLAYIAHLQEANRAALSPLPDAPVSV